MIEHQDIDKRDELDISTPRETKTVPKILILHSWSPNMGDNAMLKSIVSMLDEVSRGCMISALVSHPEMTTRLSPGLRAELRDWPWPVPKKGGTPFVDKLAYPVIWGANLFSAAIYRLFKRKVFLGNGRYRGALEGFFDSDIIMTPGGDFISPDYFYMTTFSEMMMAKILGKKLVVLGQTTVPFKSVIGSAIASLILRLPDLLIVREDYSARWLGSIGIRNVFVTGDVAFLFDHKPVGKREKRRVILCPKGVKDPEYPEKMAALARALIEKGCSITILISDLHDLKVQEDIAKRLGSSVEVIDKIMGPEELSDRIASADFIISSRMHAIILGTLSATPFFAIGDSFKFREILWPFYPDSSIHYKTLDEKGIEKIMGFIERRDSLEAVMRQKLPGIKEKSARSKGILAGKFSEWGFRTA